MEKSDIMSEKRFGLFVISTSRQSILQDCQTMKSATIDIYNEDINYFVDLLNSFYEENKELKEENEKLQWALNKTQEDLEYFANLKVTAIKGSEPR